MAADPVAAARIRRTGLGVIPPAQGLAAMSSFLAAASVPGLFASASVAAAVPVDWERLLGSAPTVPFFFEDFALLPKRGAERGAAALPQPRQRPSRAVQVLSLKLLQADSEFSLRET